ncbi:hypothetical protein ACN27G_35115 [Plantactinospora sp. WMMB334]|uniref:hypothetical protein n=1 Tax=Plantactinospora sp. WMMB334 TaxID=3404119 RepID=UPI003B948BD8
MTGHEGGQRAAETRPCPADPDPSAAATPPPDPATPPPDPAGPSPVPVEEPTPDGADAPAGESPRPGDVALSGDDTLTGDVEPAPPAEGGPAPHQRPAPGYEPTPAGPFRGATPALGSALLGAPGSPSGPSGIEPTTGAPLAMLPRRAPRAAPAWDRPTGVLPTQPGADPEAADEDDFWLPIEEVHWDGTPVQPTPRTWYGRPKKDPAAKAALQRVARPPKPQRHPALGLAGVILCSLLTSFFAWVTAEPFWLAVGHGEPGIATVLGCTGRGLGQHCRGEFLADSGLFRVHDVQLIGVDGDHRDPGTPLVARMTGAESAKAYVGVGTGQLHLRWMLGLGMVLLCAAGAGWVTGALRLPDRRTRHATILVSVAGPLLLTAGFLLAAF